MPPAATRTGSISDLLVGVSDQVAQDAPVDSLAGFDIVVQFSHGLLNQQVVRSLSQRRLTTLAAYVPWGTLPLPASLAALVPSPLRRLLATVEARLEVRLVQPHLVNLLWPVDVTGGDTPPIVATERRTRASRKRGSARVLGHGRRAEVGWLLEVNLLIERLYAGVFEQATSTGGGPASAGPSSRPIIGSVSTPSSVPRPRTDVGNPPVLVATDNLSGDDNRTWDRLTLASGPVITSADAALTVSTGQWRFGMGLDFDKTVAAVPSETTTAVNEFLATDGGNNLLTQALAPLKAAPGLRLTPDIAPAGSVSAAVAQRMNLPSFTVQDVLLTDERGSLVLSLCTQLGASTGGVLRLVRPLVAGQDFAYAVSEDVLGLAYKTRWNVAAGGLTFVAETPVELPVGDDPEDTERGLAQLSITFNDTLDDVSIRAMPEGYGDAVRLLGKQRIQLVNLWGHDGTRITDLGDLANPVEEALLLPINLFERRGAPPETLNPNFRDLLLKLMVILLLPMMQPFSIRAESVSGFCSAARKTMLVRWALRTRLDDIRAPVSDSVTGRL